MFKELLFAIDLMVSYNKDKIDSSNKWSNSQLKFVKTRFLTKKEYYISKFIISIEEQEQINALKKDNRYPEVIKKEKEVLALEKIANSPVEALVKAKIELAEIKEKWTPRRGKHIKVIRGSRSADKGDWGIVDYERLRWLLFPKKGLVLSQKVGFLNQDSIYCWTTANSCIVTNSDTVTHPETFKLMKASGISQTLKAFRVLIPDTEESHSSFTARTSLHYAEGGWFPHENYKEYFAPKSQTTKISDDLWLFPEWFLIKKGIFK